MPIQVTLPDDLAEQIGKVSADPSEFVAEAVRHALHHEHIERSVLEVERINSVADELNREAAEVLQFQVIP